MEETKNTQTSSGLVYNKKVTSSLARQVHQQNQLLVQQVTHQSQYLRVFLVMGFLMFSAIMVAGFFFFQKMSDMPISMQVELLRHKDQLAKEQRLNEEASQKELMEIKEQISERTSRDSQKLQQAVEKLLSDSEARQKELMQHIFQLKQDYESRINKFVRENDELHRETDRLESQIKRLETKIELLHLEDEQKRQEIKKLNAKLDQRDLEIKSLKKKLREKLSPEEWKKIDQQRKDDG